MIYLGGEFVGGCTDLFDGINVGKFAEIMDKHEIPYDKSVNVNPYDLLPGWFASKIIIETSVNQL